MSFQNNGGVRNEVNQDLVTFSTRAQNFISKRSYNPVGSMVNMKTQDELGGLGASLGVNVGQSVDTTNASGSYMESTMQKTSKFGGMETLGPLQLPNIASLNNNNKSPFRGFIDISMVSQKLKQGMNRSGINGHSSVKASHGPSVLQSMDAGRYGTKKKDNYFSGAQDIDDYAETKNQYKSQKQRGKTQSGDRASPKMNPKVLETWIDETLRDAEHLDIPGVLLKPEHKNPIQRYGIDRIELEKNGINQELADRIYRALFVYSVGFYELIKKCLVHTGKKYTIITAIWKVFSILLEYCCHTDYRMLISEISREHEEKMKNLEDSYLKKFQEQANSEKNVKQHLEDLQKFSDALEKEKQHEKQLRMKLEEEFTQNTKNHEEEVQLRLKFESKLNNMHSAHRDLETKFKRTKQDLVQALKDRVVFQSQVNEKIDEITVFKTRNTDLESKLVTQKERIQSLQRDLQIKSDQLKEFDDRNTKALDELDLAKYRLQDFQKEITELKLKSDVLVSTNDGLTSEKEHLTIELRETRILQKSYENKTNELMVQLSAVTGEFQDVKRHMVGNNEMTKEREDRIDKLKIKLYDIEKKYDELVLEHGTLKIEHERIMDVYKVAAFDLDDTIEKLHLTNKVRHETEIKLGEEIEKTKGLQDIVKLKEDSLIKRATEIEDMDKKVIDLERQQEIGEIKRQGIERSSELTKRQLNEKINNLNEMLIGEKETRDMWIDRYEKEQEDNTKTKGELLSARSDHKDAQLECKNFEIRLQTNKRQVEILQTQNKKFQNQHNILTAKSENNERELSTQKKIMEQFEASKKDYINKLKRELDTCEDKFQKILNQNLMETEDFRSICGLSIHKLAVMKLQYVEIVGINKTKDLQIAELINKIQELEKTMCDEEMVVEDHVCQIFYKSQRIDSQNFTLDCQQQEISILKDKDKKNTTEINRLEIDYSDTKEMLDFKRKETKQQANQILDLTRDLKSEQVDSKAKHQIYEDQIDALKLQLREHNSQLEQLKTEQRDHEDVEQQTDIGMAYFDMGRSGKLQKQDSRLSGAQSSKGSRVGGGAMIAKPPKASRQGSSNKPSVDGLNIIGNSKPSKDSGHLPNLLGSKESHSQVDMLQKVQPSGRNLESAKNFTGKNSTIDQNAGDNSTALGTIKHGVDGTIMNTVQNSIPEDIDGSTISQRKLKAGVESIDADGTIDNSGHPNRNTIIQLVGQPSPNNQNASNKNNRESMSKDSFYNGDMEPKTNRLTQRTSEDGNGQFNQNRMKVDINNQKGDYQDPSGDSINNGMAQNSNNAHSGQMQPQMVKMNKNLVQRTQINLAQSREQNKRKAIGTSTIRTLIKSAATRD